MVDSSATAGLAVGHVNAQNCSFAMKLTFCMKLTLHTSLGDSTRVCFSFCFHAGDAIHSYLQCLKQKPIWPVQVFPVQVFWHQWTELTCEVGWIGWDKQQEQKGEEWVAPLSGMQVINLPSEAAPLILLQVGVSSWHNWDFPGSVPSLAWWKAFRWIALP